MYHVMLKACLADVCMKASFSQIHSHIAMHAFLMKNSMKQFKPVNAYCCVVLLSTLVGIHMKK